MAEGTARASPLPTMTPRSIGIAIAAGLALLFGAYMAGKAEGSVEADAKAARAIAEGAKRLRDSIRTDNDLREEERERVADSVRRADSVSAAALKRRTDAVVAGAAVARVDAEKTLARADATAGELRASLEQSNAANIALTAQLAEERQAAAATLARRDSSHAQRLGALRADHARERAADDDAYKKLQGGIETQLRAAERRGVNRGRMQTLGGIGLAAIVVIVSR